MRAAPEGFVTSIKAFDSLLNVRDAIAAHGKWVIERKAYIGNEELHYLRRRRERAYKAARSTQDPIKRSKALSLSQQITEETHSAENGARIILFVDDLDRRVFDLLVAGDMRRYGGFSRYIEELEAREARQEADRKRMESNENQARSKEAYDRLNFLWKHRETELLDGQKDMTRLLQ